jgi:hypothetical protein
VSVNLFELLVFGAFPHNHPPSFLHQLVFVETLPFAFFSRASTRIVFLCSNLGVLDTTTWTSRNAKI